MIDTDKKARLAGLTLHPLTLVPHKVPAPKAADNATDNDTQQDNDQHGVADLSQESEVERLRRIVAKLGDMLRAANAELAWLDLLEARLQHARATASDAMHSGKSS